ncbi:MAG: TRAFs-binding domain-containing protein [Candidatus Methylumidiphilus sp.]
MNGRSICFVDMTLANPNVFYEMGIRHTAKPFTTVPIFAAIHNIPFDVALVRSIPYNLDKGHLTDEDAAKLKEAILARLKEAINGPTSKDSPIFQLIPSFPAIDLPHEVTEIFQDQVRHCDEFRDRLAQARAKPSDQEREAALFGIEQSLGNLKVAQATVLVDLMLSYRDASAWGRMIALSDNFPDSLKANVMVRQQRALALNRRNQPVDRNQALTIIERLVKEKGGDPETFGILGRIHKDRYKELKQKGSIMAAAALDDAIDAYRKGFESDPRDYYPGVNAVTLLIQKGGEDAMKEAQRLEPLVSFGVARRGGASSSDYWDLATVLELSVIGEDWKMAVRVLPKVMASAKAAWMIQTTLDNLLLVKAVRDTAELNGILPELQARFEELNG